MTSIGCERERIAMPRGELENFVLLCGFEDSKNVIHGIGMRKCHAGSIKIEIDCIKKSSFTPENGLLVASNKRSEQHKTMRVNPELIYVKTSAPSLLIRFNDKPDTKDAISSLLTFALSHTLHTYHGFCMANTPDVDELHPAFVFISSSGQYTALTITTTMLRIPASIYVNHFQPGLDEPSFWRATCFEPQESKPKIEPWAREVNVNDLRATILTTVLTFNAMNGEVPEPPEEDPIYEKILMSDPCPFSREAM